MLGFASSLLVHLSSWLGVVAPNAAWGLHTGIFVVWLPAVVIANKRSASSARKDFWRVVLQGCPDWAYRAGQVLVAYAVVNFTLFMLRAGGQGSGNELIEFRGFSGHWMVFYGAAAGIFYTAAQPHLEGAGPRCVQGHPVSATARYCEQCGSGVLEK